MDKNDIPNIPLGLQMALAHNANAMHAFLRLDDKQQDDIIKQAAQTTTKRELQKLVDNIPQIRLQ